MFSIADTEGPFEIGCIRPVAGKTFLLQQREHGYRKLPLHVVRRTGPRSHCQQQRQTQKAPRTALLRSRHALPHNPSEALFSTLF